MRKIKMEAKVDRGWAVFVLTGGNASRRAAAGAAVAEHLNGEWGLSTSSLSLRRCENIYCPMSWVLTLLDIPGLKEIIARY